MISRSIDFGSFLHPFQRPPLHSGFLSSAAACPSHSIKRSPLEVLAFNAISLEIPHSFQLGRKKDHPPKYLI